MMIIIIIFTYQYNDDYVLNYNHLDMYNDMNQLNFHNHLDIILDDHHYHHDGND